MKLINIERSLSIFEKKSDDLLIEFPVDLDINELKEIVHQKKHDDLLYLPYGLNKSQTNRLIKKMGINLIVELKTYIYILECHGIYD